MSENVDTKLIDAVDQVLREGFGSDREDRNHDWAPVASIFLLDLSDCYSSSFLEAMRLIQSSSTQSKKSEISEHLSLSIPRESDNGFRLFWLKFWTIILSLDGDNERDAIETLFEEARLAINKATSYGNRKKINNKRRQRLLRLRGEYESLLERVRVRLSETVGYDIEYGPRSERLALEASTMRGFKVILFSVILGFSFYFYRIL